MNRINLFLTGHKEQTEEIQIKTDKKLLFLLHVEKQKRKQYRNKKLK